MLPKICDLFLKRKAKIKAAHGYIQDYNGQALLDSKHQVIIHGEAFWDGQDYEHVPPMLDGAKDNVEALGHGEDYFSGKMLVADINYHSYNEESDRSK